MVAESKMPIAAATIKIRMAPLISELRRTLCPCRMALCEDETDVVRSRAHLFRLALG
jgi:hypothetical protein